MMQFVCAVKQAVTLLVLLPVIARAMLPRQARVKKTDGKTGEASSITSPACSSKVHKNAMRGPTVSCQCDRGGLTYIIQAVSKQTPLLGIDIQFGAL